MQFAGLALIESIRAGLHYYEPFGNHEICTLQVAKSLLCAPIAAGESIFGTVFDEIRHLDFSQETQNRLQANDLQVVDIKTPLQHQVKYQVKTLAEFNSLSPNDSQVPHSLLDRTHDSSIDWLTDIAQNIQIHSQTRIEHRDYTPLHLPDSLEAHYPRLSLSLQRQHLSCQLCNYLYRIYWSGEQAQHSELQNPENNGKGALQNDLYRGINSIFYDRLHQANMGSGYLDPDWQLKAYVQSGWVVQKQALNLWISSDRVQDRVKIGDRIAIRLPKNRINGRYYVAVGNAGIVGSLGRTIHQIGTANPKSLQICLNLTDTAIVKAMQYLTQTLNQINLPFTFAVRFDPTDYKYRDTGLLEITREHYAQVQAILQQFYQTHRSAFRSTTPRLMKPLATGIAIAEQPDDQSFGMHRCQLVAEALIHCWEQQVTGLEAKVTAIQQAFKQQGLDWRYPYLEAGSTDIYEL
jgi:hypothetical protein